MADEATDLLIRARGFIERGWCRYTFARDAEGRAVWVTDKEAVEWCPLGALFIAGMSFMPPFEHPAFLRLNAAVDGENIVRFNNHQETVEPVLAAFDRAIAAGRP
jgi:hypothetical protein